MQGVIKVLKNGYGFIVTEDESEDLFFHASDLQGVEFNDLKEQDTVSYEVGDSNRGGQKAINVTKVEA